MGHIRLGVLVPLQEPVKVAIRKARELGFSTCQVICWDIGLYRRDLAQRLEVTARQLGVEITSLWSGTVGEYVWDFQSGPATIGLVPEDLRPARVEALKRASDFAKWIGAPSVTTHVGFIPENPADPLYPGLIAALTEVATCCAKNGQSFWFETGQETPVTLLRAIQDVGAANLGINLDPANLLIYGKGNPIDALDILGAYVRGVHAKDGEYPTDPRQLGQEKPLGKGRVDFPALVTKLDALDYQGTLTIEREITGSQQIADIESGKAYLERILSDMEVDYE